MKSLLLILVVFLLWGFLVLQFGNFRSSKDTSIVPLKDVNTGSYLASGSIHLQEPIKSKEIELPVLSKDIIFLITKFRSLGELESSYPINLTTTQDGIIKNYFFVKNFFTDSANQARLERDYVFEFAFSKEGLCTDLDGKFSELCTQFKWGNEDYINNFDYGSDDKTRKLLLSLLTKKIDPSLSWEEVDVISRFSELKSSPPVFTFDESQSLKIGNDYYIYIKNNWIENFIKILDEEFIKKISITL